MTTPKARWVLRAGKALKLVDGEWSSGRWQVVDVPPGEVGNENVRLAGAEVVPGEDHVIFTGRDGSLYAQPLHVAIDPSTLPIGKA